MRREVSLCAWRAGCEHEGVLALKRGIQSREVSSMFRERRREEKAHEDGPRVDEGETTAKSRQPTAWKHFTWPKETHSPM